MYPELDGIEYVTYIRNDGKSIGSESDYVVGGAWLDRESTVENTSEPWYLAAYGNIRLHQISKRRAFAKIETELLGLFRRWFFVQYYTGQFFGIAEDYWKQKEEERKNHKYVGRMGYFYEGNVPHGPFECTAAEDDFVVFKLTESSDMIIRGYDDVSKIKWVGEKK